MRRFELTAAHRAAIHRPRADVLAYLANLPEALAFFPSVGSVVEIEAGTLYYVEIGPFGIGSFRGTVRVLARVTRDLGALRFESLEGEGNTDLRASIELAPEPAASVEASLSREREAPLGEVTRVDVRLWASPRKEVPALLPIAFVEGVARRTVERALAEGLDGLRRHLERGGELDGTAAPA